MASDPAKLKVARHLDRPGICFGMARVPGTSRIFYGSSDAKLCEVDLAAEKPEVKELAGAHSGYVLGVAVAGQHVLSGAYDGRITWWNVNTHERVRQVEAHAKWIRNLASSPDGKLVASVADDMQCKLWDVESGALVRTLSGHEPLTPHHYPSMLFACAFSADGRLLATADKVGHVVVWEVATGNKLASVEAPIMYTWDPKQRRHSIGGIRSVAFSPDGRLLAVGGTGQIGNIDHLEALARIEIFDWQQNQRTHEYPGDKFKGLVERLVFHPSGDWLVAAGGDHDGFLKFIDVNGNKLIHHDKAPMHIHGISLSDSADTLYATGHGKIVTFEFKAEPAPAPAAAAAAQPSA